MKKAFKINVVYEEIMKELISSNTSSFFSHKNDKIITEATKLSKKEAAITDPKELEPLIQKYEDAISGKKVLKNTKSGQLLSSKYLKERLRLLKKKKASLEQGRNEDSKNNASQDQKETPSLNEVKQGDKKPKTNEQDHQVSQQELEKADRSSEPIKNGICAYCKKPIKDGAKFCGACGNPIRRCYSCKKRVPLDAKFCGKCGEKLSDEISCEVCGNKVEISNSNCKVCGHNLKNQHSGEYSLDDYEKTVDEINKFNERKQKEIKEKYDKIIKDILINHGSDKECGSLISKQALNEKDEYEKLSEINDKKWANFNKRWELAKQKLLNQTPKETIQKIDNLFNNIEKTTDSVYNQYINLLNIGMKAADEAKTDEELKNIMNQFINKGNNILNKMNQNTNQN